MILPSVWDYRITAQYATEDDAWWLHWDLAFHDLANREFVGTPYVFIDTDGSMMLDEW